ncbi:ABC transporter permease [soil metagenome]
MLGRAWLWLRSMVLQRRLHREMREEMADHIERSTSRLIARGMPADEARRQAEREFGNVPHLQDQARDARGTAWLDALAADIRFALRQFARRPVTSLVMFVVLAVGMSLSTLLFSYVHSYAVQPPLGVPREDGLVRIRGSLDVGADGRGSRSFPEAEFEAYRGLTGVFEEVAGWAVASVLVDAGTGTGELGLDARATFVTDNYFAVLGVHPVLGSGLPRQSEVDPAMSAVAVIGHEAWERQYGRSPEVIGRTIDVNGLPVTIVGVAPARFNGVAGHAAFSLWLPLAAHAQVMRQPADAFRAAARLRPGVSPQTATAATQVVAARIAAAGEADVRDPSSEVVPLLSANGDPMFDRDVKLMAGLIGLLALIVLLVTCTNVSALLTGLAAARRQEIAIRLSLGASRLRIMRQLLTESALLALAAAAAAIGVVWIVLDIATSLLVELPLDLRVTWPATAFTFGVALTVGVLFGLSPALHATRLAIATAMRDSSGAIAATRARLQRGLVVAQIALTQPLVVLLAGVLVLVLTHYQPARTDDADRLVTVGLLASLPAGSSADAVAGMQQEMHVATQRLLDRVRVTAGVERAVINHGGATPVGMYSVASEHRVQGAVHDAVSLEAEHLHPGFFRVRGIPIVRGRDFTQDDVGPATAAGGDVAIILGTDLARRLWPGADPIGRRLRPAHDTLRHAAPLVVVGVVEDPLADEKRARAGYRIWLPADSGSASAAGAVLVRTAGSAVPVLHALRAAVREEFPGMTARVQTIAEVEDRNRRHFRTITAALLTAGAMALLLSAIGLYAVIAFSVGERTREIAVRLAVGAHVPQVVRRFVGDGLKLSAIGLVIGMPVSLLGLHTLLGAAGDDFPSVGLTQVAAIAGLGVLIVATAAVWIPSRRAAGVDPAVTLRE